jgi:hypothetical protein
VCVLLYSPLHPFLFRFLLCPAFCPLSLLTTQHKHPYPKRDFFFFCVLLYSVLHRTCFFVLTVLHFAFYLCLQHTTQTSMSQAGFFLVSLCSLSVLLRRHCPGLLPCAFTVQHTQHRHLCPGRDSNLQSQQAIGRTPTP